ncbi:hypothetical protein LCGC14_0685320 [marine sediment metagenome]|uniref:Uncharacterized protein n=1 Tax=marine sediment metagenome TaxID=412755 RepID=A0A0F9QM23_9ZZZZ
MISWKTSKKIPLQEEIFKLKKRVAELTSLLKGNSNQDPKDLI